MKKERFTKNAIKVVWKTNNSNLLRGNSNEKKLWKFAGYDIISRLK